MIISPAFFFVNIFLKIFLTRAAHVIIITHILKISEYASDIKSQATFFFHFK